MAAAAEASSWNVRDGRPLVPGHERRRVQTAAAVDAQLVDGQAGEGLHAGEEDAAVLEAEAVGQLVRGQVRVVDLQCHRVVSPSPHASSGVARLSQVPPMVVMAPLWLFVQCAVGRAVLHARHHLGVLGRVLAPKAALYTPFWPEGACRAKRIVMSPGSD